MDLHTVVILALNRKHLTYQTKELSDNRPRICVSCRSMYTGTCLGSICIIVSLVYNFLYEVGIPICSSLHNCQDTQMRRKRFRCSSVIFFLILQISVVKVCHKQNYIKMYKTKTETILRNRLSIQSFCLSYVIEAPACEGAVWKHQSSFHFSAGVKV